MFGWLAKLMLKTPYAGSSCACCEGRKRELQRMQRAIEKGEIENDEENEEISSASYHMSCSIKGGCSSQEYHANKGECSSQEYHAKILGDLSSGSSLQEMSEEIHKYKE